MNFAQKSVILTLLRRCCACKATATYGQVEDAEDTLLGYTSRTHACDECKYATELLDSCCVCNVGARTAHHAASPSRLASFAIAWALSPR